MMRLVHLTALAVSIAAPVRAAVLPFQATLEFRVLDSLSVAFADSGVATVNASGGAAHLAQIQFAAGAISGTAVQPMTVGAFPMSGLRVEAANLAGTIEETTGGTLRGAMGLPGMLKICLLGAPAGGCVAPLANVSVPLTPVGQGGAPAISDGVIDVTVQGAPWTTGTAAVGTITQMGFAHGPASGTSSTAQAGGSLRLVTPIFIRTSLDEPLPAFAILTLHFVPEPVTALLLGGGVALLASIGRRQS